MANDTISYSYDEFGRVIEVSNGSGFKTAYEYYPNVLTVSGTGNGDRRLKAIKHFTSTSTLDARYDRAGQLIGAERWNTATGNLDRQDAWGYDLAGNRELAQASIRDGSGNYTADSGLLDPQRSQPGSLPTLHLPP